VSRILGIDLGAYSVKVAVMSPGLRSATMVDIYERMVPAGDEPHEVRAARVLGEIVREQHLDQDIAYTALAGDRVFVHVLEFGFKNLRRPELAKAVGAELEGILPVELEDMVYTFESLPREAAQPVVAPSSHPPPDRWPPARSRRRPTACASSPAPGWAPRSAVSSTSSIRAGS
jgi:Tfp pilus assembly PilM family ATPase